MITIKIIIYDDYNLLKKYSNFVGRSTLEATSSRLADERLYSLDYSELGGDDGQCIRIFWKICWPGSDLRDALDVMKY